MARQPMAVTSRAPGPSLSPTPTPAPGNGKSRLERLADRLDAHATSVFNNVKRDEEDGWIKRYIVNGKVLRSSGRKFKRPHAYALGTLMYYGGKMGQGTAYTLKHGYVPAVRKSADAIRYLSNELKRRGWGF